MSMSGWTQQADGSWLPPVGVGPHRHEEDLTRLSSLETSRTTDEAKLALIQTGAWTDYTPVWTSTAGVPAIGNGTLYGRYTQIGKAVHGIVYFLLGSTSTQGSAGGVFLWSLPVVGHGPFAWQTMGTAKCWNPSNANTLFAGVRFYGDGLLNKLSLYFSAAAPIGIEHMVGLNDPWAWGTSYEISMHFTYEAA